jgi:hypothetical protein
MSLSQEQALAILRTHAEGNQKQFVYGAWILLGFVAMFALIGLIDAMPMWQAGLSCGVLGLVALGLWLRGTGRLGTNVQAELEAWIEDPSLLVEYQCTRINDGQEQLGEAWETGGPPKWRVLFYLADGRKVSMGMIQKEKPKALQAIGVIFPDLKRRRVTKKK